MPRHRPAPGTRLFRNLVVDRAAVDLDARSVELSFASEEPVERHWGVEVLDCSPDSCDLSRLNSGGPLLVEHDKRDQVGVIEEAWIDAKRRRGKAVVRFGSSVRSSEILRDVAEGIRQLVSVSYQIDQVERESEQEGVPTYRVLKWTPLEISIVAIPADVSVGVGRADHTTNLQYSDPMNPRIHGAHGAVIADPPSSASRSDPGGPRGGARYLSPL